MKKLILKIKYGGLGDHLFYSHLPKIAKTVAGYDEVFISTESALRNKDIKQMVWELNPYVNGFINQPGVSAPVDLKVLPGMNLLDAVMLSVGLDDHKRFHEPEIYYQPRKVAAVEGKTVYFPNYLSNAGFVSGRKIGKFFRDNQIHVHYQGFVRPKERAVLIRDFGSYIKMSAFSDFVDVVFSAQNVYSLVTGIATLGPALGKKVNVFYTPEIPPEFRHSRLNNYIRL